MQLTECYNKINQALQRINEQPNIDSFYCTKIKLWHAKRLAHEMLYDPDSSTLANFEIELKNGEDFSLSINTRDLNPFINQLNSILNELEEKLVDITQSNSLLI